MRYNNSAWKSVFDCDDFEIIENESRYAIRPKHKKIGVGIIGNDGICCRPDEFIDSIWIDKYEKGYSENNISIFSKEDLIYLKFLLGQKLKYGGDTVTEMLKYSELHNKIKKLLEENTINE